MRCFRVVWSGLTGAMLAGAPAVPALAQGAGTGPLQQVASDPGLDIDAVYSPNGQYVLYSSSRSGLLELWMRPVGGGAVYQITSSSNSSADRNPSWTPDGNTVVFQSDRVSGTRNIWAISVQNRALLQLTSVPDGAANPAVSPLGDQVCFTRASASGALSIWLMGVDGRNAREVGPGLDCAWTPDGRRIVMSRSPNPQADNAPWDVWVMDADGRNARALFNTPNGWERAPAVSPDGRWVVYTRYPQPFSADIQEVQGGFQIYPGLRAGLWLVPLDASAPPRELTDDRFFNSYASWSPDGARVIFTSTRSGSADLWEMAVQALLPPVAAAPAPARPAAPAQVTQPVEQAIRTPPQAAPSAPAAAPTPPQQAAQALPQPVQPAPQPAAPAQPAPQQPVQVQPAPAPAQPAPSQAAQVPAVSVPAPAPAVPVSVPGAPASVAPPSAPVTAAAPTAVGLAMPRYSGSSEAYLLEYGRLLVVMMDSSIVTLRRLFENTAGQPMAGVSGPEMISRNERVRWNRCREIYDLLRTYQPAAAAIERNAPAGSEFKISAGALAAAFAEVDRTEGCDLLGSMLEAPERWQPWGDRYQETAREFYSAWYPRLRTAHTRGREFARALNGVLPVDRRIAVPSALPTNPPYAGR